MLHFIWVFTVRKSTQNTKGYTVAHGQLYVLNAHQTCIFALAYLSKKIFNRGIIILHMSNSRPVFGCSTLSNITGVFHFITIRNLPLKTSKPNNNFQQTQACESDECHFRYHFNRKVYEN